MKSVLRLTAVIAVLLALLTATTHALITVTDYSWLQLPATDITTSIGSPGGGSSGHGSPDDFRWGNFVWTPSDALTVNGTSAYWATVTLDQPRNVQRVGVEIWANANQTVKAFHLDGYTGGSWVSDIGTHDYGSYLTSNPGYTTVPVTSGSYSAIRLRFEPGDYQKNGPSYGGPGLYVIEPRGDATLTIGDSVNWADKDNFGTTIVNNLSVGAHTDVRNASNWNSGLLGDSLNSAGTGQYNPGMLAGEYLQVDLKAIRTIDTVTLVGMHTYTPTTFSVEGSTDGITFTPLTSLSSTLYPSAPPSFVPGAHVQTFNPFEAQYIRVTGADKPGDYWLITQVLVNGTLSIPEPGLVGLLALGGLLVWCRRQRS